MQTRTGFIEVDLVQAEWIVTAFLAADRRMLDVVLNDKDPHLRTGSLISGAPEDFVILENNLVGHLTDPEEISDRRKTLPKEWKDIPIYQFFMPRNMSIRQAGKKANHGLNYGLGYKTFALYNEMQETDAKRICTVYREIAYPGLEQYYSVIEEELRRNNRILSNCFGQTIQFLDRWGPEVLNAAYAFKPQSTVGNITNFGLRKIYLDNNKEIVPAAQVHDSILCEHTWQDWEDLQEQVAYVRDAMSTPFQYNTLEYTLRTEVKIGINWGESGMVSLGMGDIKPNDLESAWDTLCAKVQ
jgi:hypothetical protein